MFLRRYIKKMCVKMVIILMMSLIIELLISNYTVLHCISRPCNIIPKYTYNENGLIVSSIGFPVKNILIKYKQQTNDKVKYNVAVKQYGQEAYNTNYPEKWDVMQRSTQINLNCVTDVYEIIITGEYDISNIESVVLNSTLVRFNFWRFFTMCLISALYYIGKRYLFIKAKFRWRRVIILATITNLFILYIAYSWGGGNMRLMSSPENQDMNMVAEALSLGQAEFVYDVDEKLLNMDNPYDYSMRNELGVNYIFDATYYKGHFYTYFGVAPVLVLFLPCYILTGRYIHTYLANIILMVLLIYFFSILYKMLIERYSSKISMTEYVLGYYTIIIGSGVGMLISGEKYDVCMTSALLFTISTIIIMLRLNSRDYTKVKLTIAGITTGLIVLSKPNFGIWYIVIFYMLTQHLKKMPKKEALKNLIFFIIPLAGEAILQMVYNYVRFDNIFEFGNQYQTGANIQMFNYFSIMKIIKGLEAYFFTLPSIDIGIFPFITLERGVSPVGLNTYSIVDVCVGLIAVPAIWIIFFKNRLLELNMDNCELTRQRLSIVINIGILVAILQIIACTTLASINEEYLIDVRGVILTMVIMLCGYAKDKSNIYVRVFLILCIATIIIMLPISLDSGHMQALRNFNELNIRWKNLFEFWT